MVTPIALTLLALIPSPAILDERPTVNDLAWMQGDWRMVSDRGMAQEIWSQPDGDNIMGMFRWQRPDGSPMVYELLSIREEETGLVLRLRHFDKGLTPWEAEADGPITLHAAKSDEHSIRFEDRGEGLDVEAMTYSRDGDRYRVFIEFDEPRGPLELNFTLSE